MTDGINIDYGDEGVASIERASDIEKDPAGVVRRWLIELKLADKREDQWRKQAGAAWSMYRQQKKTRSGAFNILWANTEVLRPAVYNSLPKPDVRRRYKDADPLGKAVSEVLSRSLEYSLDTTDFDSQITRCVLDMLIAGRGVARIRYIPSLQMVGQPAETHDESTEMHAPGEEALEGENVEELQWEQVAVEHVQWDDFRMSSGKCWDEITWIAFRHRMTREQLEEKFPDCGADVTLDSTEDEDVKNERDERIKNSFKTGEVWEIWDKDEKEIIFISGGYKESPLDTIPDPLSLQQFFPLPPPLYAIEDSASMVPLPLYEMYKQQAIELDSISMRINIIVKGLKLRGIYDSTITEMSELMRGEDNDLIPAENVTALFDRGGIEKAIWMWPVETAAKVLNELYVQREQCKSVIYEITGISDILRGNTNANETATAQRIKNQWGSQRLKRMQADVAKFIRDLMRLQAEIIGERFQPETLATMTGIKLPSMQEKQMALMQAQQSGQPAPQLPPSWEEVIQVLRDDKLRTFKVDVETDSTIAQSIESDMSALRDVLTACVQLVEGFGPAVQMGAMPVEALKEMILAVTRRAKLGNAVEDALEKIQQPQPPQQQQDNSLQVEQTKQQGQMQLEQARMQSDHQIKSAELQHEQQMESMRLQHEYYKLDADTALKKAELEIKKVELEIKQAELMLKDREIGIKGQEIEQRSAMDQARFEREGMVAEKEETQESEPQSPSIIVMPTEQNSNEQLGQIAQQMVAAVNQLGSSLSKPKIKRSTATKNADGSYSMQTIQE